MLFDQDQNGKISVAELKQVFNQDEIVEEKLIKELIEPCDKNNDGQIDFEEFSNIIQEITKR